MIYSFRNTLTPRMPRDYEEDSSDCMRSYFATIVMPVHSLLVIWFIVHGDDGVRYNKTSPRSELMISGADQSRACSGRANSVTTGLTDLE